MKKRRINKLALIVLILIVYLIAMTFYLIITKPIEAINIAGNEVLSNKEILDLSKLKVNESLFKVPSFKIKSRILKSDLVKDVEVNKNINGVINIKIDEENILFYNLPNNKYRLSNNKEIESDKLIGYPVLVNFTPSDILEKLVNKMKNIDSNIINLISEIEYSPDTKDNVVIDKYRFVLRMNDGNRVFINIANFEKLSKYKELYSIIEDNELGTFYLDGNRPRVLFRTYEAEASGDEAYELPN